MAKLKINVRDRDTDIFVAGSEIIEAVKIEAMIRRVAEAKGWGVTELRNHLDSGRAVWVTSEDGKLVREIYFSH